MTDRDRETLTEQIGSGFDEGGLAGAIGSGVKGAAQMMLPQSALGQYGAGPATARSVFQDFVEYSPYGDVQDMMMAVDPDSGLDWLERGLALVPIAGFTTAAAIGTQRAVVANRRLERANRATTTDFGTESMPAASTAPEPGSPYGFFQGDGQDLSRSNAAARLAQMEELEFGTGDWKARIAGSTSWEELALGVLKVDAPGQVIMDQDYLTGSLRYIGQQIVAEAGPNVYGKPDVDMASDVDVQAMVAAQSALMRWQSAIEDGRIKVSDLTDGSLKPLESGETVRLLSDPMASTQDAAMVINAIVELERKSKMLGLGPGSLAPTPQTRVSTMLVDKQSGEVRVVMSGVGELLPTNRLLNADNSLRNPVGLDLALEVLDYDTVVGDMAVNLVNQSTAEQGKARFAESSTWYRRFNGTSRYLADLSGRHPSTMGAVFSSLSPQTAWVPDNLVAAVHSVLRYTMPDLDPMSPEYRQHFKNAVLAGEWSNDLYKNSNSDLRTKYESDPTGIIDYWADVNNLITERPTDPVTGELGPHNTRGMADQNKKRNVAEILLGDIPWELVLRQSKTHQFAHLADAPMDAIFAVIDTHSNNATFGMIHGGEPKGSGATRRITDKELDAGGFKLDSGRVITREKLEQVREFYRESGFGEPEIEKRIEAMRQVPSGKAKRRYRAQQMAHQLAAKQLGYDTANEVQSTTWVPTQGIKKLVLGKRRNVSRVLRQIKEGKTVDTEKLAVAQAELDSVMKYSVWDFTLANHLEGNPTTQMPVVGMTTRATDQIDGNVGALVDKAVSGHKPRVKAKPKPSEPLLILPNDDGTVTVYADPTFEGVTDTLRHLAPTPWTSGEYALMVPRKPRAVRDLDAHAEQLASAPAPDGLPSWGYIDMWVGGDAPALRPGNRMILDVSDPAAAQALVDRANHLEFPFKVETRQVARRQAALPRENLTAETLLDWGRNIEGPGSVFETHDWISISAFRGDNPTDVNFELDSALRADIEALGYKPVRVDGVYPDDMGAEPSWMVFGLPYEHAVRLSDKYNQESVATRQGLMFTRDSDWGPQRGQMLPNSNDFGYGNDARASKSGHTTVTLPDGRKTSFVLRYSEEAVPVPGFDADKGTWSFPDVNTAHVAGGTQQAVTQVEVDFGGVEAGVDWRHTDKAWNELSTDPAVSGASMYLHGTLWQPPGSTRVHESTFSDAAGRTGTWRSKNGSVGNRHQAPVFVRDRDSHQYAESDGTATGAVRTKEQVRAVWTPDTEQNILYVDGDLEVHFPADSNVESPSPSSHMLGFKVNDKVVREATVAIGDGMVPRIMIGDGGVAGPGMVQLELRNGKIVGMIAQSRTDVDKAIDALGAIAVNPVDIDLDKVTIQSDQGLTEKVDYTPSRTIDYDQAQRVRPTGQVTLPEVREAEMVATRRWAQALMPDLLPHELPQLGLSDVVAPNQASILADTLEGLIGKPVEGSPLARFVEEHGGLPAEVFSADVIPGGIQVATITGRKTNTMGLVVVSGNVPQRGILLNEKLFVNEALGRQAVKGHNAGAGQNAIESVVVHESAHVLEQTFRHRGHSQAFEHRVFRAWGEMNGLAGSRRDLSHYSTANAQEFFAEAFADVVYNPNAPQPLKDLVRDVLGFLKAPTETRSAIRDEWMLTSAPSKGTFFR